jgi:hypothetical protein
MARLCHPENFPSTKNRKHDRWSQIPIMVSLFFVAGPGHHDSRMISAPWVEVHAFVSPCRRRSSSQSTSSLWLFNSKHKLHQNINKLSKYEIRQQKHRLSSNNVHLYSYGRGAEIWPPTNEIPFKLEDSFPFGRIPVSILNTPMQQQVLENVNGVDGKSSPTIDDGLRRLTLTPRSIIDKILKRVKSIHEEEFSSKSLGAAKQFTTSTLRIRDAAPAFCAIGLLVAGLIRPLDVLLASFLSGYTWLLVAISQSMTTSTSSRDSIRPTMPSLPPQGHVPSIVANPLGYQMTHSLAYDRWLTLGIILGFLCPFLILVHRAIISITHSIPFVTSSTMAAARPLFLLLCQAVIESICRRAVTPLPIRIWIPVAFNTIRLGYLWQWALMPLSPLLNIGTEMTPSFLLSYPTLIRGISMSSFLYWFLNLFAFLLPVAVIRYMRAHFFGVEAEQVILRPGMENTIGLM